VNPKPTPDPVIEQSADQTPFFPASKPRASRHEMWDFTDDFIAINNGNSGWLRSSSGPSHCRLMPIDFEALWGEKWASFLK
jgi:hypothetical protein